MEAIKGQIKNITPPNKKEWAVISGEASQFLIEYEKFKKENTIHERHITTQAMPAKNPKFTGVIGSEETEYINTFFIHGLINFTANKLKK